MRLESNIIKSKMNNFTIIGIDDKDHPKLPEQARAAIVTHHVFSGGKRHHEIMRDYLPEDHLWAAGNSVMKNGVEFVANMPTEEIFTAPLKTGINGVVYSAMPLVDSGNIIDKFHFIIRDGKIVEAHAEKGEEFLKAAISVDEGASYFGEVALVPYDSPISNQKILFYNTLFDENASCHLAFGEAYPECIEGGESMTREEVQAHGLNYSLTHVDFMVGTADLSIVGTTHDGREIPVFINGNFAI